MELTVKLQVFEGPLDLLLHLLEKNKVNIYDIPIVEITNQYMEYIAEIEKRLPKWEAQTGLKCDERISRDGGDTA